MPGALKTHWPFVIVASLLALNIVLVGSLMRRDPQLLSEPASAVSPWSAAPVSASPSSSATPAPSSDPARKDGVGKGEQTRAASGVSTRRQLVIGSANRAWRATLGDCDHAGVLELSVDGGASWKRTRTASLSPITSIQAMSRYTVVAVGGGGKNCAATYKISYVSGDNWESRNRALKGAWYRVPNDTNTVAAPGGDRSTPCTGDITALAPTTARNAIVLCTDGSVLRTKNQGRSWRKTGIVEGAVAVSRANSGYLVASLTSDCDGVTVDLFSSSGSRVSRAPSCAPIQNATAGNVAVAKSGRSIWVWAAGEVLVSRDAGKTW
jgi:hypothetical protein